jgi:two-component system copper resistance phosphate regulon response regulator CusR
MRILLVEDDPRIAKFVAKGLRERSYAVDVAVNGNGALYQIFVNTYDLVILDVMIPKPNGFEVCHELRRKGLRIPVLMLTARDAINDRIQGLDAGADDYLTKPFDFGELLARLRALFRRSWNLRTERIIVDDLVVDPDGQTATRAGRHLLLTTKEYNLLEYMALNVGRVIGREEIAEHVWDETFDPFSNLIEVYVNRLRRKVDEGSPKPLIHTRRGAGYVLEATTAFVSEDADSHARGRSAGTSRKRGDV